MTGNRRLMVAATTTMFIVSGFSGLVYQAVWSQYLGLLLGHSAYAQALVLAIFMGGMALGSALTSRSIDKIHRPVRAYGAVEGVVGIAALLFHMIFVLSSEWMFDHFLPTVQAPALTLGIRWVYAGLLILPQTILLGMTFPLMSSALIRAKPEASGPILGLLYFANSIGGALGALLSTFLIVPAVGLPGAMTTAGLLNVLIFLGTLILPEAPRAALPVVVATEPPSPATARRDQQLVRTALLAALVTGLSSLMYEIGWIRMLSMVLGTSLHAFEIMLASFIGGLAFGGLAVRRWLTGQRNVLALIGYIQLAMGAAALLTLLLYGNSFGWVSWLLQAISHTEPGYVLFSLASAGVASIIMLPAAFFAGMTLPALSFLLIRETGRERVIGQVYAVNTMGAIAGVFVMIHLAIPLFGLKVSMVLAGLIDLLLGLYLLNKAKGYSPGRFRLRWLSVGCLLIVSAVLLFANFDPRTLASGVYRTGHVEISANDKVFYYADGKTASVAMTGTPEGVVSILTNGKPDASLQVIAGRLPTLDEPTMVMAGMLGFAHRPDAEYIGVIGFGAGLSTHTALGSERVKSIETVEIEREMVRAAFGFGDRVDRAYSDPRSHIIYDDARAYFSVTRGQYDIIISEPSNPWVAGVAKLFSREFYAFIPNHLRPGGLMVQWLHTYEIDTRTVLSILGALNANFSDYRIFVSNDGDMIVVATPEGKLPPISERLFESPGLAAMGKKIGVESVIDLELRVGLVADDVRAMLKAFPVPVNSDFQPYVAYHAPADRFRGASASDFLYLPLGPGAVLSLATPPSAHGTESNKAEPVTPPLQNFLVQRRLAGRAQALELLQEPHRTESAASREVQLRTFTLRALGNACFAGYPAEEGSALLLETFELTALADRSLLARVWDTPGWLQCDRPDTPSHVKQALGVFRAIASGNQAAAVEPALALATQFPRSSKGWFGIALLASSQQAGRARSLWREWESRLPLAPNDRLYFQTLVERLSAAARP